MKWKQNVQLLIQTAKEKQVGIIENLAPKEARSLAITGAAGTANIFVGLGKLVTGILSLSLFTCVSAFYTFGMVIAKYFALEGIVKAKTKQEQYRCYFLSGIILVVASILFVAYSLRLFLHPATSTYSMYAALCIATFTFAELGINIRGVIVERHNHTPLFHAIKMINLASSLICLVLTQTAILSFSDTQVDLHPAANGLIGVVMGLGATAIGIIMIVRIRRIQTGRNYHRIFRKVKKLIKAEGIPNTPKPVWYNSENSANTILHVVVPPSMTAEQFKQLCVRADNQLNLQLIDTNINHNHAKGRKKDDSHTGR